MVLFWYLACLLRIVGELMGLGGGGKVEEGMSISIGIPCAFTRFAHFVRPRVALSDSSGAVMGLTSKVWQLLEQAWLYLMGIIVISTKSK